MELRRTKIKEQMWEKEEQKKNCSRRMRSKMRR
jgi:hypothetical protein